jgi:hypothetical protein
MDELSFRVPDGWVDRSIQLFTKPEGVVSLNVTRAPLNGEAIGAYAARQLEALSKGTTRLHVIAQRARTIEGVPSYEARLQWAPQGTPYFQHQVYVPYYDTAVIFTVTGPRQMAAQCDAYLEQALADVRFRKRSA